MSLWMRLRNTFRTDRLQREIDDELESHIADFATNRAKVVYFAQFWCNARRELRTAFFQPTSFFSAFSNHSGAMQENRCRGRSDKPVAFH